MHEMTCPRCSGDGELPVAVEQTGTIRCPRCRGTGSVDIEFGPDE